MKASNADHVRTVTPSQIYLAAGLAFLILLILAACLYLIPTPGMFSAFSGGGFERNPALGIWKILLSMAIGLELPTVLLAMVKIGRLDYKKLVGLRRYVIVWNLVLGALLTTPEIRTQFLTAVALQLACEASTWLAWAWQRQPKKA